MTKAGKLWTILIVMSVASFSILGLLGREIHREAPPIPNQVMTYSGTVLFTKADIQRGREVWQSMGGQQVGSVWGHGGLVAPDWSADFLHREATTLLNILAQKKHRLPFDKLNLETQAAIKAAMKSEIRTNTYDEKSGSILVTKDRAQAIAIVRSHYEKLLGDEASFQHLREAYALAENPLPILEQRKQISSFFYWISWASGTNRPNQDLTYTSNWPHEPLIDNLPTTDTVVWSVVSVMLLIAGIGTLVWYHAAHGGEAPVRPPEADPLNEIKVTPSMRATTKYFWTAAALFMLQIILGGITAHYSVEGQDFYGFPLSDYLPYAVTRTWHTQLAVFWIATAWLGTGLYIAPALSGLEPKFQRLGVNVLWLALVAVVLGSMAGEWAAVQRLIDLDWNFYFGHQGYEYVDLGRFWQVLLLIGLFIWVGLVGRALWPALKTPGEGRPLVLILFLSSVAIGLFYGAGLSWGKHTHLSMVEYWRWWVVHLWVEGFFEVFATTVIALLTVRLGLVRQKAANQAVLFGTIVFLTGGILGTLHHLYFSGTPTSVIAVGALFSALEVVPLALIGFEAYDSYRHSKAAPWVEKYRWAILCFVAVAFWNLVGAGLFGFMINPPISLYYIQGLNTTALHGHTALFGVYGMLGIGLILFCLRGLYSGKAWAWNNGLLKWMFISLNAGLVMMALLSLLPVGAMQAWAAVDTGFWFARSAEFLHQEIIHFFVWMRVPGDVIFAFGGILLIVFMAKLALGKKSTAQTPITEGVPATPAK